VLLAIGLSAGLVRWDQADPVTLDKSISAASAVAALSALSSGMLAFTGFVTTVVLLVIQYGSSQFSPRFVAWLRRDPTLKFALSGFSATFVFALVSTAEISRGNTAFVPSRVLIAALILLVQSIAMFLLLIDRTSSGLRVARGLQSIDRAARRAFDAAYPAAAPASASEQEAAQSLRALTPVQAVRQGAVGSVLVALNRNGLAAIAAKHDAVIDVVPAPGDTGQQEPCCSTSTASTRSPNGDCAVMWYSATSGRSTRTRPSRSGYSSMSRSRHCRRPSTTPPRQYSHSTASRTSCATPRPGTWRPA
jgi:uncharacterized membrane protein